MRHGDHLAVKTFNCYLDLLAHSLAQLVIYYDPDVIVVGGGISNISEIYMYLPDLMSDYLFKGVLLPKIVGTKFSNHSALLGAAIIGAEGSELVTQLD
jgi:N-acetylglucosamine kinase